MRFPKNPNLAEGMKTSQASTPGFLNIVVLFTFCGLLRAKFSWYVSKERNMFLTLLREMLQYLPRNASVMGCMVEGSSGVKYLLLTSLLFSSDVANALVPYMSFPFWTLRLLKYLHHAGLSAPLVMATMASWMHCVPGFINNICLCSLERAGRATVAFLVVFAPEIRATRVSASSSAVDHNGTSLFSQIAFV